MRNTRLMSLILLIVVLLSVPMLLVVRAQQPIPVASPWYLQTVNPYWVATAGGPAPVYVPPTLFPTRMVTPQPTATNWNWFRVWLQSNAYLYSCPSDACLIRPQMTLLLGQYVVVREAGPGWYQVEDSGGARWATGYYIPAWTAVRA